jgi:hypothetical protein
LENRSSQEGRFFCVLDFFFTTEARSSKEDVLDVVTMVAHQQVDFNATCHSCWETKTTITKSPADFAEFR